MKEKQEVLRNKNIDLLKAIAILMVVFIHALIDVFPMTPESINSYSLSMQLYQMIVYTITRMGVPIFLMVTGYLFLDRDFDNAYIKKFWKRNFLGLLITIEIWLLLYNIYFLKIMHPENFGYWNALRVQLFVQDVPFEHNPAWYLPVILGIYLFIPFVARALKGIDVKLLKWPFIVVCLYLFVKPIINPLLGATGHEYIGNLLSLDFSGGAYGTMVIMGYLVKKKCFAKIHSAVLVLLSAASIIAIVFIQLYCNHLGYGFRIWYDCALLLLPSVFFFELICRIRLKGKGRLIKSMSVCSFGIYLIHKPILIYATRTIQMESEIARNLVIWISVFVISFVLVWLIGKIPVVKKYLFFIK